MTTMVFCRTVGSSPTSELLFQGYSRRTTAAEPRLSELVAEYLRIGYDVEIIEHQVEPNSCGVCFNPTDQKGGEVYCDIYVRPNQSRRAGRTTD